MQGVQHGVDLSCGVPKQVRDDITAVRLFSFNGINEQIANLTEFKILISYLTSQIF